jgi:hypothetical protein
MSNQAARASGVLFVEELVALILVGDHHDVRERVALPGEGAYAFGQLERKRETNLVARFGACRSRRYRSEETLRARRVGPAGDR